MKKSNTDKEKKILNNLNSKGTKMKAQANKFSTMIILSLLPFVLNSNVHAKEETKDKIYVKEGTYLGVYRTINNMSGDFDDTLLFGSSYTGEILDVPDVDDGTGFGIVLGSRADKGAVEFGYQRSKHDTSSILFGDSEASYSVIDMNFKIDVLSQKRTKPYILFGFGIPWLTIEDNLYDVYGDSFDDATFLGFALNAGGGIAYYIHPQWAVTGGIIYRWNWFSSAEGMSLDDTLSEKAFCFNIGLVYTF